jgi:hypothetical protein
VVSDTSPRPNVSVVTVKVRSPVMPIAVVETASKRPVSSFGGGVDAPEGDGTPTAAGAGVARDELDPC